MNLENIMLSGIKTKSSPLMRFLLYEIPKIGRSMEIECRLLLAKDWGWGGAHLIHGYGVFFRGNEYVSELEMLIAQHSEYTKYY